MDGGMGGGGGLACDSSWRKRGERKFISYIIITKEPSGLKRKEEGTLTFSGLEVDCVGDNVLQFDEFQGGCWGSRG